MARVTISDPTLRDGNHAVRHQLKKEHFVSYCKAADLANIPIVEVGHGNGLGAKLCQRLSQPREVGGIGEDGEVRVAAKLGRAVEHARLSAHEQGADAMRAHRRKDFAYRVRDQVSLQVRDTFATIFRFPASVRRV